MAMQAEQKLTEICVISIQDLYVQFNELAHNKSSLVVKMEKLASTSPAINTISPTISMM